MVLKKYIIRKDDDDGTEMDEERQKYQERVN